MLVCLFVSGATSGADPTFAVKPSVARAGVVAVLLLMVALPLAQAAK